MWILTHTFVRPQEVEVVDDESGVVSTEDSGDRDSLHSDAAGHDIQCLDIPQCLFRSWSRLPHLPTSQTTPLQ